MNVQDSLTLAAGVIFVVDLVIRIAALIVIPRNRKPSSALAWLLAIFFIPFAGIIFFLVIGSPRLPAKRQAAQSRIDAIISAGIPTFDLANDRANWPEWFTTLTRMNQSLGSLPVVSGNTAVLIDEYRDSIDAMTTDIESAQTFVHVQFYIVALDDTTRGFFSAMEAAVSRGVTVRVLLDHIASVRTATAKATIEELDRIGVDWRFMLPVQPLKGRYQRPDLRNHRKLVVVDGYVGYVGSQNLIARSYNSPKNLKRGLQWQELMTRITGPVVASINIVFMSDWYSETQEVLSDHVAMTDIPLDSSSAALDCQIIPSGPGYARENNLRLFIALMYYAQKRIIITSPYFVPDEAMMYAITSACQRGLDVQLFVSELGDQGPVYHAQRSYYLALLEAGVRIWLYPAPFILHAKHFSIDDDVAVIGSSNMDIRSFALDLEISMLVRGASFVRDMRNVEDGYRSISRELTLADWKAQPWSSVALDGIARLTSALQ